MSSSVFKQGNFEMEKMINENNNTSSSLLNKIIILDNTKEYYIFDGLKSLDGYLLTL